MNKPVVSWKAAVIQDGLHQAIEAKENVKIEAATQTYATVTLQNYFRMYRKLAGMTGTAVTEAGEFGKSINWMWLKFQPTYLWSEMTVRILFIKPNVKNTMP